MREISRKNICIEGGAHDDKAEWGVSRRCLGGDAIGGDQRALQNCEHEVHVHLPFMSLIYHHMCNTLERLVLLVNKELQKQTDRHERATRTYLAITRNAIADAVANLFASFGRHALCQRDSSQAARLRAQHDRFRVMLHDDLRNLGTLSAACIA